MLKNVPSVLSPELLKVLCEMGHGDTIAIGDGNFPAASVAKANGAALVRCDGHGVSELLGAVLEVFPLDAYVERPATLMQVVPGDDVATPIWDEYAEIIGRHDARGRGAMRHIERFAFYEEAKQAFAVVATGERALYANIILKKGVIT
jgi:L-fucose mutarotase